MSENTNPILMTQAEYARHRNKGPKYIGKLYKAGILVMRGRLVDVAGSDAVLDPIENQGVVCRPTRGRVFLDSAMIKPRQPRPLTSGATGGHSGQETRYTRTLMEPVSSAFPTGRRL